MQWIFVCYILLATATNVLSRHHQKRDLSYIKNFIATKLFGNEIIVIQKPEVSRNETYQLFKIKGYDNILLKVIRKPKQDEKFIVPKKVQDPVMVSPEIAIVGNYLGTATQGETLRAIKATNNLLNLPIPSDEEEKFVQDVVTTSIPQVFYKNYIDREPVKTINVLTEDRRDPVYFLPAVSGQAESIKMIHRNPIPVFPAEYPSLFLASEINFRPLRSKYSYKQKGETADMTYESYNNQDVIVTRTIKEPPLPQYIKLRFADIASIGADPYLIRSKQPFSVITEELLQPINVVQRPYDSWNPPIVVQDSIPAPISTYVMERFSTTRNSGKIEENINKLHISTERNSTYSKPKKVPNFNEQQINNFVKENNLADTEIGKTNNTLNIKTNFHENREKVTTVSPSSSNRRDYEKETVNEDHKNYGGSEQLKSNNQEAKHFSSQDKSKINEKSENVGIIGAPHMLDRTHPYKSHDDKSLSEIPKNFVYVPPKNANAPAPSSIPKINNIQALKSDNSGEKENYPEAFFEQIEKLKEVNSNVGILKVNDRNSPKKNPIGKMKVNHKQRDGNTPYENRSNGTHYTPYLGTHVF